MTERVTIDIQFYPNPTIIAESFFAAAARSKALALPMRAVVQEAGKELQRNFDAEGRPTTWEPLAAATLAKRSAMGTGSQILHESGDLESAATQESAWHITPEGNAAFAELIDDVGYGHFHLTGTTVMPQRDWSYLSEDFYIEAEQTFTDWITLPLHW